MHAKKTPAPAGTPTPHLDAALLSALHDLAADLRVDPAAVLSLSVRSELARHGRHVTAELALATVEARIAFSRLDEVEILARLLRAGRGQRRRRRAGTGATSSR